MNLIPCPACQKQVSPEAVACPDCGHPLRPADPIPNNPPEPQFEAYRKRVLIGSFFICVCAVPIGILLNRPAVWILGLLGLIVASIKLSLLKSS